MSGGVKVVHTIGHSNHSWEAFLSLLQRHAITAVADVRSSPYSAYTTHFNRQSMDEALRKAGIHYVFLGAELGARTPDTSCYEHGRVRYDRLARTGAFQAGIERVLKGAETQQIALMCAEKDPLECHRTLLVARALVTKGIGIRHILADGTIEDQEQAMTRLLSLMKVPSDDLFLSREQLVAEALARQEEKVAYVDEKLAADAGGGRP
jgi:uncharacterized protein (DUF488 family)